VCLCLSVCLSVCACVRVSIQFRPPGRKQTREHTSLVLLLLLLLLLLLGSETGSRAMDLKQRLRLCAVTPFPRAARALTSSALCPLPPPPSAASHSLTQTVRRNGLRRAGCLLLLRHQQIRLLAISLPGHYLCQSPFVLQQHGG